MPNKRKKRGGKETLACIQATVQAFLEHIKIKELFPKTIRLRIVQICHYRTSYNVFVLKPLRYCSRQLQATTTTITIATTFLENNA